MKSIIQLLAIALILLATSARSAQVQNMTIYFDKDKAVVSAAQLQKLQALKAADMVLLQGHTDAEGSESYNVALSKRRVEAIKEVINQIDPGIKTEALSYGESKPVTGNKDEIEKQLNRRVEINWVSDPMLRIKTPVQFYEVDATKSNTVTCREGTKIEIPAGAFADKKVLLKVSEYYNTASILSANLSTKSDGKTIESAGMIYITAEANGQSVEPNQPLKFKFPRNNKNAGFKVFEGERSSNFEMNWKLPAPAQQVASEATAATQVQYDTTNYIIQTVNNYYTSTITGDVFGQLTAFWDNLVLKEKKEIITNGCIQGAVVDIAVNTDGRITSVLTSYTDKNSACDREVQKYIRACLPQRFKPLQWESKIQLYFDSSSARYYGSTVSISGTSAWTGDMDYANADYETDKIVLTSANLGWINCDRFLNAATTNFSVQADKDANVRMILKKYKSFFTTVYRQKNTAEPNTLSNYVFNNVPVNEEALIISTRKVNGKILLAIENTKTFASGSFSKLNYKEVTQAELESTMKNLKI
ncbi:MAG TPA: OmpA family protein [Chitinophagales bacterium]|nr:OmpA family protein [Chitinophagales bacterium]